MEKIEIILNDFLFNSGVLGLYRILQYKEKENLIEKNGNTLNIDIKAFDNFAQDYIDKMLEQYEKDTKYFTITKQKELIRNIDVSTEEGIKIIEEKYKMIKSAVESASYKSGYEIIKEESNIDPYEILGKIKNEKNVNVKKELILQIIEHLEEYKKTYCMKDIIYTKINSFWENVSFLNSQSNKKDIKGEYVKTFTDPFNTYISKEKKGDLRCIECGNQITKTDSTGMSWISDIGVDMGRKKSAFWNFNEDMHICPVCNLIYSCIPLGFSMIGSNGIFVNNNENFAMLVSNNNYTKEEELNEIYQKILQNAIQYEPKNIQVIKRLCNRDNKKYKINIIPKDKLEIIKKAYTNFQNLIGTNLYQIVLTNLLEGIKQYNIIAECLKEKQNMKFVIDILQIQLKSMGGINVKERQERIDEMIKEGENLNTYFFINKENENKLKSYIYKLQNALKANNVEEFMKFFTLFYGGLGKPMPRCEAIKVLIKEPEYFRILGYSYIYGLEKYIDKKENEGGNENEK